MLQIGDAAKSFGPRTVWSGVDLDVPAGAMVALTGASGCGKSTLLACIGGLSSLDSGRITVDGRNVDPLRAGRLRRLRRDTLGFLFQNYALVENATVAQNLFLCRGPRASLLPPRTLRREAEEALDRVGLGGRGRTRVHVLSGGERQRVALARLILKKPRLILADEPTGALDGANAEVVVAELRAFATDGASVVVATHDPDVERSCDRALHFADGHAAVTA